MVSENFLPMRQLMTDAKILDSEGNEVVKLPFLYGNAIVDDTFNVFSNECH